VASKRIEGNDDKSKGFNVYMDARSIIKANVIFKDKRRSKRNVGKGITISIRTDTTPNATSISLFFEINGIRIEVSG
jgi:hypothetical protein